MVISLTKKERAYLLAFLDIDMTSHMEQIRNGDELEYHAEDMELIRKLETKLKKG